MRLLPLAVNQEELLVSNYAGSKEFRPNSDYNKDEGQRVVAIEIYL